MSIIENNDLLETKRRPKPTRKLKIGEKIGEKKEEFIGKIRLNKMMKDLGLTGRREADQLIDNRKVLVNGKIATIGMKVSKKDKIEIKSGANNYLYYTFYKPKDVVSHSPQYGEEEVKNFFPNWDKDNLTIVGRLDKHTEGLMFVTNDKKLVERILDPKFDHEKTYEVQVQEKISSNIVRLFSIGFEVRDRFEARPAKVELVNNYNMNITLTEGKKHQIRLMLNELHYTVSKLKRVAIMNLGIKALEAGKYKIIPKEEIIKLYKLCGLK